VHGMDGLDEISLSGPTKISRLSGNTVTTTMFDPAELGFQAANVEDVSGGDPSENAHHLLDVLNGKLGPRRDIAVVNAAAALVVAEKARNMGEGVKMAAEAVDSGNAQRKLTEFLEFRPS